MSNPSLYKKGPGEFCLTLNDKDHPFRFPDQGNMEKVVTGVIAGREYIPLRVGDWQPSTILDIGANVGAAAVFFSMVYPKARIWSWEPSRTSYEYLEQNISWIPRCTAFDVGLFNEARTERLYQGTAQCAQASLSQSIETRSDQYEEIRLVPAREAVEPRLNGPTMMKLDTEGCEVHILEDLGELVPQVDLIYLEYHSERDRRHIDQLLTDHFSLWKARTLCVHRGTLMYVNQRLIEKYPVLGLREIRVA